jgi:hypothetical protein
MTLNRQGTARGPYPAPQTDGGPYPRPKRAGCPTPAEDEAGALPRFAGSDRRGPYPA